ncbi:PIN-like domain-containing protein [Bacillus cereus group sp. Bce006]|uniref:PIN-like domain-containing protein n=1 Tax=Bacillus cereus group sp. Bce006 TaxID=3445255 RepID=UPI003F24F80F|nr:PIN-like domain-containing protein [Bacillus cereus]MCU5648390.1 PIN-like domain-containing protein [Bacillus cereus]
MQNELEKLFIKIKPLEQMIKNAKIVVDTNVLLSAYQTKPVTFKFILEILEDLAENNRLKIPAHVIEEFNEKRPDLIKDIADELQQFIDNINKIKNTTPPKKLNKILPAIDVLENSYTENVLELQNDFNKQLQNLKEQGNKFKDELNLLVLKLCQYMDDDPILKKYEKIIRSSYFKPELELDEESIKEEGERRFKEKIPPGFKDDKKENNKYGDLIIWLQMCELKEDIIFITFDNKSDWIYKDSDKNILGAKRSLVEEYYEKSGGKSFKILHPGDFGDLYSKGKVTSEVKEDMDDYTFSLAKINSGVPLHGWDFTFHTEKTEKTEKTEIEETENLQDIYQKDLQQSLGKLALDKNVSSVRNQLLKSIGIRQRKIESLFKELEAEIPESIQEQFNRIVLEYKIHRLQILLEKETADINLLEKYNEKLLGIYMELEEMYVIMN